MHTSSLHLSLLGSPQIKLAGEQVSGLTPRKVKALLFYLAYTAQPQSREHLADFFFDERSPDQAAANLRAMISRLRGKLGSFIVTERDTVAFDTNKAHWLDTAVLGDMLHKARQQLEQEADFSPETAVQLSEALALYRGDFLTGFNLRDARGFDEWILLEREHWHQQVAEALQALVTHHLHRREYAAGIKQAQLLLRLDNLQEGAHRQLMLLLARAGKRSAALAQYATCRQVLRQELDIEPLPRTTRLYERIRAAESGVQSNLPPQFTTFVGRTSELAQISRRLDDPNCRLLTLVGDGGVGKTRLALEAVAERAGDYLNGIFFVPLAALTNPTLLVTAVANSLNFTFSGKAPLKDQLLNHLRSLELLLLLDNFEHLLEGADLVVEILKAAPDVKIVVTSRERLRLSSEWVLDVSGLPFPEQEAHYPVWASEKTYAAVELFYNSARRARAGFALGAETTPLVWQLCRLVEGLPLGLELAAAALRERSLPAIVETIAQNAADLDSAMRDVPARHHSLRAVFAHSWSLLSSAEKQVFKQLSVFRGDFDLAAARAVAEGSPALLVKLEEKTLLRPSGNGRYDLHELWRQLGAEQLTPAEKEAVQEKHGRYYAGWLAQKEADIDSDRQIAALEAVNADIDNIRAGWSWAVRQQNLPLIQQFLPGLMQWYYVRTLHQESVASLEPLLQILQARIARTPEEENLLGQLLAYQGTSLFRLIRFDEAEEKLVQSLAIFESLGESKLMGKSLGGLANIAILRGDMATARQRYQRNLGYFRQQDNISGIASSLEGLAAVAKNQGEFAEAAQLMNDALDIRRQSGTLLEIANAMGNLGAVLFDLERYTEAEKLTRESLAIRRTLNDQHGIMLMSSNLAELMTMNGRYDEARVLYEEALQIGQAHDNRWGIVMSFYGLGEVYYHQKAYDDAEKAYLSSFEVSQAVGLNRDAIAACVALAKTRYKRHELESAARVLAFCLQHKAASQEIINSISWLRTALEEALPAEKITSFWQETAALTLEEALTILV